MSGDTVRPFALVVALACLGVRPAIAVDPVAATLRHDGARAVAP